MTTKSTNQQSQDSMNFFDSELFKAVQMSGLFVDSKTFADAIPKVSFTEIISQFHKEKENALTFNLGEFVKKYFYINDCEEVRVGDTKGDIHQHIELLWDILKRTPDADIAGSLLPLKNAYIVPGGRFREIYYWDSYFTALGLIESNHVDLAQAMLNNFIDLQSNYGCIPNGNRSYYLSRSQPPILGLLVELLLPFQSDKQKFIKEKIKSIETEYKFWMNGKELLIGEKTEHNRVVKMPDGSFLNRYWDDSASPRPESYREDVELLAQSKIDDSTSFYRNICAACESGWDFSSRWLGDDLTLASIRTTRILPVDLNCLLFKKETLLSAYYAQLGNKEASHEYAKLAVMRKTAIQAYMWSDCHGFFMDYNLDKQSCSTVKSLAGVLPLFVELASSEQANQVGEVIQNEFLQIGGLTTTITDSSQQWDSPNGWAPLQWFSVVGLLKYQQQSLATTIQQRWLKTVADYFQQTGKLMEKYNVFQQSHQAGGGEYDVQEGFGWTNGVYLAFNSLLKNSDA